MGKFTFDAQDSVIGVRYVTLSGSTVGRQIKEQHKVPIYIHVMGYLKSGVQVMNARYFKVL
jgi:hypothetical protein